MPTTGKRNTGLQKRRWGDGLRLLEWVVLEGSCNSVHHRTENGKRRDLSSTPILTTSTSRHTPSPLQALIPPSPQHVASSRSRSIYPNLPIAFFHVSQKKSLAWQTDAVECWPRGPIYCWTRAQSQVGLLCLMCSNFNNNILFNKFKKIKKNNFKEDFFIFFYAHLLYMHAKFWAFFLKKEWKHLFSWITQTKF